MSCHVKDPREVALRERRDDYAAVHAAHYARQAAERYRWIAALDQVTDAYRARVAIPAPEEGEHHAASGT